MDLDVGGYVLAGGKSSRMGRDKALLELAGKPLVLHAVRKLRRVCAEVHILSGRAELGSFAPLVWDLHAGCGPLGGMEAAMAHSRRVWNLFMPVDVPFLPVGLLEGWVRWVVGRKNARISLFMVDGRLEPALCLLHKEVAPWVERSVERGELKVLQVLEAAGRELADRQGAALEETQVIARLDTGRVGVEFAPGWMPMERQLAVRHLWFANLNTPEEFAEAEAFGGMMDSE